MTLAAEDKRFAIGVGVAVAVAALYLLAVRGPLGSAAARGEQEIRALQPRVDLYFRSPKATPFDRVGRELDQRLGRLEGRLRELAAAVEFDPGSLEPAGETAGAGGDLPDLYFKLSSDLHDRIKAKAEKAARMVRVPAVFDPQGAIRTPEDAAAVPRLHRQLVMAYQVLDAAIDHGVEVGELRALPPRLAAAPAAEYLEELAVTARARGSLGAVAAWLHGLGQPPAAQGDSRFLSVGAFEVETGRADGEAQYALTFVSVAVNPKVGLASGGRRKTDRTSPQRGPRRAPLY